MSLAEDIRAYRKKMGHSMNDVSQLTGIPADRIYKWEKGTKPNDAEDLLKIREYLDGKLEKDQPTNLEEFPKKEVEPSAMQILSVLADAFKTQAEILRSIENKMAQESTQAIIGKSVERIEANLQKAGQTLATLQRRQELGIEEFREQFQILTSRENVPSGDDRKKVGRRDGNG